MSKFPPRMILMPVIAFLGSAAQAQLLINSLEDLEAALQRARFAGATLADNNVEPVALVENVLMINIEEPNGLFLELATGF